MKTLVLWWAWILVVLATRLLRTQSLLTCMDDSEFTATNFDVRFYPQNRSLEFELSALSTIEQNTFVEARMQLYVYGINVLHKTFTFCQFNQKSICPFQPGHIDIPKTTMTIDESVTKQIPGIAYNVPDLDARVRVFFYSNTSDTALACVEAVVDNGKTVQTKYASWPIAAVSGAFVIVSWVVSIFGYSATATHIALNTISLFVYFQLVAIVLMQAVERAPPIAAAWAQNFMWLMGIFKVHFLQAISNWFVQLTGGTGLAILYPGNDKLSISIQKKRDTLFLLDLHQLYQRTRVRDHVLIFKRAKYEFDDSDPNLYTTNEKDEDVALKILVLRGMQRIAYLAGLEISDLFMTLIAFLLFVIFCLVVAWSLIIPLYRLYCKKKYRLVQQPVGVYTKGMLYRMFLVSFPQVLVMCVWQFFERDLAGTIVFAAVLLLCWLACLLLAVIRVLITGSRLIKEKGNPAAGLYGNLKLLMHIGNIYMGFRADRFWWIPVAMFYTVFKCLMVACLQEHGKAGALIVFITEFIHFIAICVVRPYMDTSTNAFNILLSVVNTLNALFFAFFSDVFTQPQVVLSIMGIIFFILNAVVSLIVLLWMIITCLIAIFLRNSDGHYKPVKDDRLSFVDPNLMKRNLGMMFGKGHDQNELRDLGDTAMNGHEQPVKTEWSDSGLAPPLAQYMNNHSQLKLSDNNFAFNQVDRLASLVPLNGTQASDYYNLVPQQPHLGVYGQQTGIYYNLPSDDAQRMGNYPQELSLNPYDRSTTYHQY